MNEVQVNNNFSILSPNCLTSVLERTIEPDSNNVFENAIKECFQTLLNISFVCQKWNDWQKDKNTIIHLRFTKQWTYRIDFPENPSCIEKIKAYMKSVKSLNDLRGLYVEGLEIELKFARDIFDIFRCNTLKQKLKEFSVLQFANWHFSPVTNVTKELINLISLEKVALVGKFLLHKPNFDVNLIAQNLSKAPLTMERVFLISLMIKLKYDMTEYFNANQHYVRELAQIHLFNPCVGIGFNDYKTSGCNFSRLELISPKVSVLQNFIPYLMHFYKKDYFHVPSVFNKYLARISINDEVLNKHIRKEVFSENDLKDYLVYLLTEAELNLDIICPSNGKLNKGSALSQMRVLGKMIVQQPNAVSLALKVYDQGPEEIYNKQDS